MSVLQGDLAIVSLQDRGEDSDASRDVSRRQITTTDSVTQVGSALEAGGSASLSAGGDIGLLASRVEAGEGLGLVAGGDITLASAANSSESHTRKPNKTYDTRTVRQQGSELAAGTDLTVAAGASVYFFLFYLPFLLSLLSFSYSYPYFLILYS